MYKIIVAKRHYASYIYRYRQLQRMKKNILLLFILALAVVQIAFTGIKRSYELRNDGYYFSYDHIKYTSNDSIVMNHYAMILYEDSTLSDFYNLSSSKQEFEKILQYQSYKTIKDFSKFGSYQIIADSIFINLKTQRISGRFENYNPKLNARMKGVIVSDIEFKIVESEIEGTKYSLNHTFNFVKSERGQID